MRLYKLHGSIDQYQYMMSNSEEWISVRIPRGVELDSVRVWTGTEIIPLRSTQIWPSYLTGRKLKLRNYTTSPFSEIWQHWRDNLTRSSHLIIIGYGFKDEGVNEAIQNHFIDKPILVFGRNLDESSIRELFPRARTPK